MTGLDQDIEFAKKLLTDKLWVGFDNVIYGRSFRLQTTINGQELIRPYSFNKKNDYVDVLVDDRHDSIIHFDVEPNRDMVSETQGNANVNIIFAVNIAKVYGYDVRDVEQAHQDALRALKGSSFRIHESTLVTDINGYEDYGLTNTETKRYNMQPFYVFKIQTDLTYNIYKYCNNGRF